MAQATTKELTTLPVGRLGLVSLESSRDLGNKVDTVSYTHLTLPTNREV